MVDTEQTEKEQQPWDHRWNGIGKLTAALVVVWIVALIRLMIADVWDETNALVVFGDEKLSIGAITEFVLTTSVSFWRPPPTFLAALVIRFTEPEVAWRLLRAFNMLLILCSVAILSGVLTRWGGPSSRRTALFSTAVLYSGAGIICGGWFANIFDVTAMFLISIAVRLLSRERFIAAGVLIGAAFFFKETAAMALPFLLLLVAVGRITVRQALNSGIPAAGVGGLYFVLRSEVIPFGSAADTHQFLPTEFLPTVIGIMDAWWRQSMWGAGPGVAGMIFFVASVAAFRTWRARGAFLLFVLAAIVIYWGMFASWQNGVLIHHLTFLPRLLFIPATLSLFVLALDGRRWALPLLLLPILWGGVTTYRRYQGFQRSYKHIYKVARRTGTPLRIYYPWKPLSDPARRIEIGDLPDARMKIDPVNGRLVSR